MRISDWSSDVCSSDLTAGDRVAADRRTGRVARARRRDVVETGRNDVTRKRGAQHVVDLDVIIIKRQVEARQEVRLKQHAERPGIGRFGQIGRAAWREKGWRHGESTVVAVLLKKKQ